MMVSLRSPAEAFHRTGRTIAVGDIHGCATALRTVLAEIEPTPADTIVTIGDYIDRGPDSLAVLDTLIELRHRCHLVPLLGNHEQMLFSARASEMMSKYWQRFGGDATLRLLGPAGLRALRPEHLAFLESCQLVYETPTHFFIHANYDPARPIGGQDEDTALSLSLFEFVPGPHHSGKTAIVGHTAQSEGEILDLGYLKCIDTDCCDGGYLTALDVTSGQIWRAREIPQRSSLRQIAQPLALPGPAENGVEQERSLH
ncbi:MAG TPA: metallophosphoesterase family protein [Pirellulales bacterium]|nr:metallophosphoesterase family protein [Pirellulales bacterium]